MKSYFLLIILVLSCSVFGQSTKSTPPKIIQSPAAEPCSLKLNDSPTLRGLRLDMPKAQVQKEYPLMKITTGDIVSSGMALSYQITNPDYQDNMDRITVVFRNNKIISILLTYNYSIKWDSMEEFAEKISKSLNLPKATPRKRETGDYYSVNCEGFGVRTRINSDNQATLFLTKDPDDLWESTKQKKDAFKP
jgi:hypothetical protein